MPVLMQFQEGKKLPTTFAFALVEHRQIREMGGSDLSSDYRCLIILRLRMYLTGEVMYLDGDKLESRPRLLNMRSLVSEVGKSVYILKVNSAEYTLDVPPPFLVFSLGWKVSLCLEFFAMM